jgi:anti-anti-sigma factor
MGETRRGDPAVKEQLVVDLSRATFIDSTGLAILARVLKRLWRQQAELVLHAPNRSARKLLRITGLDKVMTIQCEAEDS